MLTGSIEKQYHSVTPKQAQALINKAVKKLDPDRLTGADVEAILDEKHVRNLHFTTSVKDGVRTTTDHTQDNYIRIDYEENGSGKVVDYKSSNYEYVKRGYKTTTEQTEEADYTETYIEKVGQYQYYRRDANEVYNIILEFDFHSDTKGSCYYYEMADMK